MCINTWRERERERERRALPVFGTIYFYFIFYVIIVFCSRHSWTSKFHPYGIVFSYKKGCDRTMGRLVADKFLTNEITSDSYALRPFFGVKKKKNRLSRYFGDKNVYKNKSTWIVSVSCYPLSLLWHTCPPNKLSTFKHSTNP